LLGRVGCTQNVVVYPACILATIGLSAASYQIFESRFLRMKDRFASVLSGESARSPRVEEPSLPAPPAGPRESVASDSDHPR
jgi:peptidoglycan/LPS O-acetylase OafA/YrhL